jgi:cyanophycin synthetase
VPGGFLQRVKEGTYAGHILEHVTLELQNLAGMRTGFGKTRSMSQRGHYKVAFRTRQEQVGRDALAAGRELLLAAINDTSFDLPSALEHLRDQVDSLCLGPSTSHIVDAATARRIPSIRLTEGNLVQLGYGIAQRRIWTAETDQTSAIAEEIASDKDLTKSLLASCGVPVPEGELVRSAEEAWEAAQNIGVPVVLKPYDGNHGRGVSLDLRTQADVEAAYALAHRKGGGSSVIVEKYIDGNEHRLLIVGRHMVAAARGESVWVTGDGMSNIDELTDLQINSDPRRGSGEDSPLNAMMPSKSGEIILELERAGLKPESIPAAGQRVLIQRNGNVAFDCTDLVHPSVAAAAALAARVVGLDIAGVDMVLEDITKPLSSQRGAVIEVNASPGLLAHIKPAGGQGQPVGAAIINHLFGDDRDGRIPVVGVTGSVRTGRIARLVSWLIHISGKQVGLACSEGMYLDGRQVVASDCTHWEAGQRLLINRSIQAAVFENPSRTILAEGLAYDKCLVGVVTDVSWHKDLSEFDIHDAEQAYKVTRTVVDVILPQGVAVLNSADPQVVEMADLCDGEVIFYGLDGAQSAMAHHQAEGKRTVFVREGSVVMARGNDETVLLPLSGLKPAKASQPEMVLAAVAAAWALNIPPELIGAGLRTFESNPKKTPY